MKFYTDFAKLTYLIGCIDSIINFCKDENASDELKYIGTTLQKIKGNIEE